MGEGPEPLAFGNRWHASEEHCLDSLMDLDPKSDVKVVRGEGWFLGQRVGNEAFEA